MPATDSRPNFVLIMPDQHRGDCLSLAGHPAVLTPNLDSIGGAGVHFTQAYTTCPSCIAARRSLMTGQFPATHGMVGYHDHLEWNAPPTLPGVLREHGYQTALVGRTMHLYPTRKRYGFDEMVLHTDDYRRYLADNQAGDRAGMFDHGISRNGYTARPWHLDEKLHPTTWTVTEALRFLERRDPSCPFFLVVSFIAPHPPLVPPAFYLDRYLRQDLPAPALGDWATPPPNGGLGRDVETYRVDLRGELLRSTQAGYYGLINHMDDQICRLLGTHTGLDAATRRNTVLLFTSDHGEMLGDHYLFRKYCAYEGSAHIPFLISGPEVAPGRVCHEAVCLEDLMPTVLDLAGCPIPDTVEGRSLVPILRGHADALDRDYVHGEHTASGGPETSHQYLTDGREKYLWFTQTGEEQLFNLAEDPRELQNLAGLPAHAERLGRWRRRMAEHLRDRPEGFSDGDRLIAGRPHNTLLPHASG
ncbi:MAG: arylsulfatase [Armatimonadetes bacterium]|nr:arylsulfatase [Armatimonadota bacterium]